MGVTTVGLLKWGVLFLVVAVFCIYSWAIAAHFRRDAVSPKMTALSIGASIVFAVMVITIWFARPQAWMLLGSALVQIGALTLFLAAVAATRRDRLSLAFTNDAPSFLKATGPYARIRHPFYTAYTLYWWACALASGSVWAAVGAAILTAAYASAAISEEKKFEQSALKADYDRYRRTAGFFWPRLLPARN